MAALVLVAVQLPAWRTGLFVADEGWTNDIALRMARGDALYRDVHSYLPPLTYWVLELPMRVRPSLVWGRLLMLLVCAAFGAAAAALTERRPDAPALAVAGLAALGAGGYPSYTIPSYTGLSVCAGLIALLCWDRAWPAELSGALLAAALLFKQTTGFWAGVALVVAYAAVSRRSAARLCLGGGVTLLMAAGVLALRGSLGAMLRSLSPATLAQYGRMGTVAVPSWSDLATPRLSTTLPFLVDLFPGVLGGGAAFSLARLVTFALYYLPVPLVVVVLVGTRGADRGRTRALALLAGLTFLALFPRADVAHLSQVLPPTVVLAALVTAPRLGRRGTAIVAVLLITSSFGLNAYRRSLFATPLDVPRDGGIRVRAEQAETRDIIRALARRPGEPLVAAPWGALYYFLADRRNPTPFELLLPGNVGPEQQRHIVSILRRDPPPEMIFSAVDLRNLTPVTFEEFFPDLVEFRDTNYRKVLGPVAGEELWRLATLP